MSGAQLPALQIVLPLLAAPLCVLLHRARLAWALAAAVSVAAAVIAGALLYQVLESGPISYALGGWAPPWGIEYRVDALNAFLLLIVSGASAIMLPYARRLVETEIASDRIHLFYALWMLSLTGLLGIAITGDAFNLFVFLEISSLSTYALVSLDRDRRALVAAFRYLIIGTVGATFILIGIGLLYMMTGTLNMVDLAERLPALTETRTVRAAVAFVAVGVFIKMALFPLHFWLPNTYAYAPSPVSAFLAATATKVAVYVLIRFVFDVFGVELSIRVLRADWVLLVLSLAAVSVASCVAVFQSNVKRMLAYSSLAQIGYMTLGLSFVSIDGLTATIVHLFNHALAKAALFMAIGCVIYRTGARHLEQMRGLAARMPWTFAAFAIGGLSLIGVPLTAGFISKWYLVLAAIGAGAWLSVAIVVIASLIAVIYIGRVVEAAYFGAPVHDESVREAPLSALLPLWVVVLANLWFGLDTTLTTGVARRIAASLLGVE